MSDLKVNIITDLAGAAPGPDFPDGLQIAGAPLIPYTLAEQAKLAFIDVSAPVDLSIEQTKLATIEVGAKDDQTGAEIKALYEVEVSAFTDAQFTKLAGIEALAKDDQTGAEIKALYEVEVSAFTDAQFTKLAGIEALAKDDQTGAEIKALYEVEVSAFTDAQFTKLAGIEALAKDDQTGAEIKALYEVEVSAFTDAQFTKLAGIEALATADQIASEVPFTPNGDIAAAFVQAAIVEVRDDTDTKLALKIDLTQKGAANGVATLDGTGRIPAAQLSLSAMEYKGTYDASGGGTGAPALADGVGDTGDVYVVSVAGTVDHGSGLVTYGISDWVIYNGAVWQKSDSTDAVTSVNGFTGVVILDADDIDDTITAHKFATAAQLTLIDTRIDSSGGAPDAGKLTMTNINGLIDNDLLNATNSSAGAADQAKVILTNALGVVDDTLLPSIQVTTATVADADKVVSTDAGGVIDASFLPDPVTYGGLIARIEDGTADIIDTAAGDMIVFTGLAAARAVSLPAGVAGDRIRVMDGGGASSTFTISVGDAGNTMDGTVGPLTMTTDYEVAELVCVVAPNTWTVLK